MRIRWSREAQKIIEGLQLDKTAVAVHAGLGTGRMTLWRYLNDKRTASPERMSAINAAIGETSHMPEAEAYLNAVALLEQSEGLKGDPLREVVQKALASGSGHDLLSLDKYFDDGWLGAVEDRARKSPDDAYRFIVYVALERRRHLGSRIRGVAPKQLFLDAVLKLSDKHGIDLANHLRPEAEEVKWKRAFLIGVDRVLAETDLPIADRARISRSIYAQFLTIYAILSRHSAVTKEDVAAMRARRSAPGVR